VFVRAGIAILSIAALVLASACGTSSPLDPSLVSAVTVDPGSASVPAGGVVRFTANATDADGNILSMPLRWTSSNPAVAIVDASGRATHLAPGTALIRAIAPNGIFGEAMLTVTSGGFCSSPPDGGSGSDLSGIVYRQGFEAGPINSQNTPGLQITTDPDVSMEWQSTVVRTGGGAYHMRGGDLTGDGTIHNQPTTNPFGGLEVWAGGAFCFVSFPDSDLSRAVWLIATVPTDGIQGAGDKPVAGIGSSGRLELLGSNSVTSSELDIPLQPYRWYYLVVHGVNGVGRTQELYLYDGTSGELLGKTGVVLDVSGTFTARTTKWGFGTSQDSNGLEYYLDDIYHASGSRNPGPIRVAP
jgi:hypothetical protein